MDKDKAFQEYWDKVEYPRIANSPISFILMKHIDDIKNELKLCWDSAWEAKQ